MITFAIFVNAQYHMSQTLKCNLLMIHTNSNDRKVRKELTLREEELTKLFVEIL